ncbi:MBL fold metallo-hydrolase [Cupriavidus sp. 2KB_3]|uniref:MBL fold metallo-hydrolase n=1 Tax=Cupriavidus TaxID=106589 RepID=UPI0011EF954E|nr:MBL fold metallo-hydrolase [Cupriavidus campinensis]
MAIALYESSEHVCMVFTDLVDDGDGEVVQSNQFLVVNHGHGALIDPGGPLTYGELYMAISRHFPPKRLDYVLASHADPDIVASVGRWLTALDSKVLISQVWARFLPHICQAGKMAGRVVGIPDAGMVVPLGASQLVAVPAHFLHSEGNFHFYDPISKILFSGDLGAAMTTSAEAGAVVEDFDAHLPRMLPFHRRYMSGNRACRLWAEMARTMDIEWIVPQHGPSFRGRAMVKRFIDWVGQLECGLDLLDSSHYRVPAGALT